MYDDSSARRTPCASAGGMGAIVGVMRVTKVGAMRLCGICERTLLLGERSVRFAPEEGAELGGVCPLCEEIAVEHGWLKKGPPTTPIVPADRRRRRRGLGDLLGLRRDGGETLA